MDSSIWYETLIRPSWAPDASIFGPVWTVLYAVIAVSFGTVFVKTFLSRLPMRVAVPFGLNLLFNFAFTPIQFGLRSNVLAAIDIVLVLVTLIWALVVIRKRIPWVAYANTPYLLWVTFATALQMTITYLNF